MAWTYEQKFNDLNTADLNGQDSWVRGNTNHEVLVVEDSSYEGTKCIRHNNASKGGYYYRAITAVTDGTFYFAMKRESKVSMTSNINLRNSSNAGRGPIRMGADGYISYYNGDTGAYVNILEYDVNQWYVIAVEFDTDYGTYGRYRCKVHNGTSWSDWGDYVDLHHTNTGDIAYISIDADFSGYATWWDTITPTDPTVVPVSRRGGFMAFF